jgi:cyclophilin family peptidyl-prolyl cis-trans isomerase/transposase-like protein
MMKRLLRSTMVGAVVLAVVLLAACSDGAAVPLNQPPNQPNHISPADGDVEVSLNPTLQSSDFSDPDDGDTHAASQWQITAAAGDYGSPLFNSGTDGVNLTQIAVEAGILSDNTTYYWRVRCQDNHGDWSEWSTETSFTTMNHPPTQPSDTWPAQGAVGVSLNPTLRFSTFSDPDGNDTQVASQWRITATAGDYNSPVFDNVTDDYLELRQVAVPEYILSDNVTYYWQVRCQDNHGAWSPWSEETSFTTENRPNQPINVSPDDGVEVSMSPVLQSSDFSDPDAEDTHAASQWRITAAAGDYGSPVFDSGTDSVNLTEIALESGILGDNTTYYWQVRYRDDHGAWSSWSAETSFTTVPNRIAVLETSLGIIKFELYEDKAPITTANFIGLAESGFYSSGEMIFHRVIDDFMIQTGDPEGTGAGGSDETIPLEVSDDLTHVDGAVAMARSDDPNSARSQFYICDGEQPDLDGSYAVFGQVIEGMDVVRAIAEVPTDESDKPLEDVLLISVQIVSP